MVEVYEKDVCTLGSLCAIDFIQAMTVVSAFVRYNFLSSSIAPSSITRIINHQIEIFFVVPETISSSQASAGLRRRLSDHRRVGGRLESHLVQSLHCSSAAIKLYTHNGSIICLLQNMKITSLSICLLVSLCLLSLRQSRRNALATNEPAAKPDSAGPDCCGIYIVNFGNPRPIKKHCLGSIVVIAHGCQLYWGAEFQFQGLQSP